jgi:hypothetical protein
MRDERKRSRTRVLVAWLLVAACIVMILSLGSGEFGARGNSRYLFPLLRWLFPDLSVKTYLELAYWMRKSAHVAEYALLGLLAFRAVFLSVESALARVALLSLGVAATVAVMDEFRQTLLPERTGSVWDIAIDVSGALAAIGFALWLNRRARLPAAARSEGT